MTSKLLQLRGSGFLKVAVLVSGLFLIFSAQTAKKPEAGALRGVVKDSTGAPFARAVVELCVGSGLEVKYRGTSSELGIVKIERITPGDYTIRIKAPGRAAMMGTGVRIVAGHETDVGSIIVGPVDCTQPGIICDDFGHWKASFQLPCAKGLQLLRNSVGSEVVLSFDKLKRRVVHQYSPEWPQGTPPGESVSVYVVIGVTGAVLCGTTVGDRGALEEAALTAAQKWQFKPVLEKGLPVSVLGILEFEVP